jgi:hypothetical protein
MANGMSGKGVIVRLFGVVFVFLGMLNSMLFWRAGNAVNDFFVFLIVSGVALYVIGAIRRERGS